MAVRPNSKNFRFQSLCKAPGQADLDMLLPVEHASTPEHRQDTSGGQTDLGRYLKLLNFPTVFVLCAIRFIWFMSSIRQNLSILELITWYIRMEPTIKIGQS